MRFGYIGIKQTLGVIAAMMLLAGAASADASSILYQGLLRDSSGTAVSDGAYAMEFSIWDAATGGTMLWTESNGAVAVSEGAYLVLLGGSTPFGALFADQDALWLQVAADIGAGLEVFGPRVPLNSAPYAKKVEHADHAATATTATHATTADSATNATHATSADSATNATNATTADNTAQLGGELPSAFATATHTHDASHINAGTLSTDRYSAYTDLGAESKIGAGAAQVAAGDHRHTGLPYFIGSAGGELTGLKSIATAAASGITNDGYYLKAPVAGRYYVHFQQLFATGAAFYLELRHNGGNTLHGFLPGGANDMKDIVVSRIVNMNAGDTISFYINGNAGSTWGAPHSTITMWLIG
ncbi:MAG: hypothetical protein BWX80_03309 [Candidatus Hydrogenedentes bacterium ADurb.Bin101]|nr:MAG: hypothetical protein BWX80_03309 [Candidatus Hydrogenedentes bacterium ADurb.Bin101]